MTPSSEGVATMLAVLGLAASAPAAAQFTCTGTICFSTPAACDDYRASERDEGDDTPACRTRAAMFCVTAVGHYDGDELAWCTSTAAACRARVRDLQAANRRTAVHLYEDIGECLRVEWDDDDDGFGEDADACPGDPGPAAGCPDADGDGTPDIADRCPGELGRPRDAGCPAPDGDGDGVEDRADPCPTVAGTIEGCPDADGDGFFEDPSIRGTTRDLCPGIVGTVDGCGDFDEDGRSDARDACPRDPASGTSSWRGCPDADADQVPDVCFDIATPAVADDLTLASIFVNLSSPSCGAGWFADLCLGEREDWAATGGRPSAAYDGCPTSRAGAPGRR